MLTPKERAVAEMLRTQASTLANAAHAVLQNVELLLRIDAEPRDGAADTIAERVAASQRKRERRVFGKSDPVGAAPATEAAEPAADRSSDAAPAAPAAPPPASRPRAGS